MPGSAKKAAPRSAAVPAGASQRHAEIYDRHAPAVYRQALLMLGDENLAGQVTGDVILAECALPAPGPGGPDRVSARLAASTLRRCQELLAGQPQEDNVSHGRHTRGSSGSRTPDGSERAVLGLVLFGGMGYREAARELAITPSRAAGLLREALITLANSPDGPRTLLPGQ